MKKFGISILALLLMLSVGFSTSVFATAVGTTADDKAGVTYRTHIQNEGWAQGWINDGGLSGSEGKSLRLEAINIKLTGNVPAGLGIEYRTHIQNIGWNQGWISNGGFSGSEGQNQRLEAIQIRLTGENASEYTVKYQTHIENEGWSQGWVSDGAISGTEGKSLRLEAIEIRIEKKTATVITQPAAGDTSATEPVVSAPVTTQPSASTPTTPTPSTTPIAPTTTLTGQVNVPAELLNENATNSAKQLGAFLATCSGKTVIFPANKVFVFDGPVPIANVQNIKLNFNGTSFKLPDGYTGWDGDSRSTNSTYVGNTIFSIVDVENVEIYNLKLNGNSQKISTSVPCYGVWMENASSVYLENFSVINVDYHGVVVSQNTKNISFEGLYLENNYGTACSSDVYIQNNADDSCSFNNVIAARSTLIGDQVYYINGYNTSITNLSTRNCSVALDYRKGKHTASGITMDNCNATIHVQTTSNVDLPDVTVKNLTATNIRAGLNTKAGLGIWSCSNAYFENVSLTFAGDATTNLYGVIIRRFTQDDTVANVHFKNLTVNNTRMASVFYCNLNSSSLVENLTATPTENYLLRADSCTAVQEIDAITSSVKSVYDKNSVLNYTLN